MAGADTSVVLVVDDNDSGRYSKARSLRQAGFEVLEAASGAEALQLVAERTPRLVILDVKLPDLDGWAVCRRIKTDAATASTLVLQMSATYVSEADTVHALEGGADGCLTEPVEPPVLVATVRALLRARQAEDAVREALAREQAARAAAEAANRTKDEFLATLSHELRSPLNAILTWVTLLRTANLDEDRRQRALEGIERNTRLQTNLIEDLLDVSRIISGKMVLDVRLVDLASVVEHALETVRPAADAKAIRVETTVDATLGPVAGDAGRLQQVVWNLLSNAVKFTGKGGRVEVRVEGVASIAQIRISDTGRGIDPGFLPHIFERFRQADASSTRSEGGLGLGLAIVRHLVEMHGGTVEASSRGLGTGTTFTIRLPLPAIRTAQGKPDTTGAASSSPESIAGVRVLIVEDDRDARESIAAILEAAGGTVTTTASVGAALASVADAVPDVIVSDIGMPREDGYTLIRRLRELRGDGSRVPALALTAYAGPENRDRTLAAGYDAYLTKPVEPTELIAAVKRAARPVTD